MTYPLANHPNNTMTFIIEIALTFMIFLMLGNLYFADQRLKEVRIKAKYDRKVAWHTYLLMEEMFEDGDKAGVLKLWKKQFATAK